MKLPLNQLSSRDRRAVLIGGIALGAIVLMRLTIIPFADSWADARNRSRTNGEELTQLNRSLRRAVGQRERLARKYGPGIRQSLVNEQAAAMNLFQSAKDVFSAGGIRLTEYQPQRSRPVREIPNVSLVTLQVKGQGDLPKLAKCLHQMTRAKNLMFVQSMNITNNEKQPGQLDVTLLLATLAEMKKN
ncbi:MAG: type II secretion system protein M [Phycisphaerae bacterium]|nr:type II secretion system protein M [Phycisphaerae bacterium]